MILLAMRGRGSESKLRTLITLSFSGRLANWRINLRGAFLPTGTQSTLALFCSFLAACLVLYWLMGIPSVMQMTTMFASSPSRGGELSATVAAAGHGVAE